MAFDIPRVTPQMASRQAIMITRAPQKTVSVRTAWCYLASVIVVLRIIIGLVTVTVATTAVARPAGPVPAWPDDRLGRVSALAVLQSLNAELLSNDSATLILERWCEVHELAAPAKVVAHVVPNVNKPLPMRLREQLQIGMDEPVKYRRVYLQCGEHVLSEADNWYLPERLTVEMNRQLETTALPFGKVVRALNFRRETLAADLLWSPLPVGWEMSGLSCETTVGNNDLDIPRHLLQHHALLFGEDNRPFSALIETYTNHILAFPFAPGSAMTRDSMRKSPGPD